RPSRRCSARCCRRRRSTSCCSTPSATTAPAPPRARRARSPRSSRSCRAAALMLSASDIETYRSCPLRYKFARVLRVPQEPTLNQRFGILVHQVLERFHATGASARRPGGADELLGLLDAGWRRGGFGDSDQERQLR